MATKTVDQKSYDLAKAFLADTPGAGSERITMKLAQEIQGVIEDFLPDVWDDDLRKLMDPACFPASF